MKSNVTSNYPLAVVNRIVADQLVNEAVIGRELFGGSQKGGVLRYFTLGEMECVSEFEGIPCNKASYIVRIEVIPSSGQQFIVAELPL